MLTWFHNKLKAFEKREVSPSEMMLATGAPWFCGLMAVGFQGFLVWFYYDDLGTIDFRSFWPEMALAEVLPLFCIGAALSFSFWRKRLWTRYQAQLSQRLGDRFPEESKNQWPPAPKTIRHTEATDSDLT